MTRRLWPLLAAPLALAAAFRTTVPFDRDWRFLKANAPGAEQPGFADAGRRALDVPHDWSIEGPIERTNPTGGAGAFLPGGIGWYRKRFTLPAADAGRRVFIEFDGVMANGEVWIKALGPRDARKAFAGEQTHTSRAGAEQNADVVIEGLGILQKAGQVESLPSLP